MTRPGTRAAPGARASWDSRERFASGRRVRPEPGASLVHGPGEFRRLRPGTSGGSGGHWSAPGGSTGPTTRALPDAHRLGTSPRAAASDATTSTPRPIRAIRGARMKTPMIAPPAKRGVQIRCEGVDLPAIGIALDAPRRALRTAVLGRRPASPAEQDDAGARAHHRTLARTNAASGSRRSRPRHQPRHGGGLAARHHEGLQALRGARGRTTRTGLDSQRLERRRCLARPRRPGAPSTPTRGHGHRSPAPLARAAALRGSPPSTGRASAWGNPSLIAARISGRS